MSERAPARHSTPFSAALAGLAVLPVPHARDHRRADLPGRAASTSPAGWPAPGGTRLHPLSDVLPGAVAGAASAVTGHHRHPAAAARRTPCAGASGGPGGRPWCCSPQRRPARAQGRAGGGADPAGPAGRARRLPGRVLRPRRPAHPLAGRPGVRRARASSASCSATSWSASPAASSPAAARRSGDRLQEVLFGLVGLDRPGRLPHRAGRRPRRRGAARAGPDDRADHVYLALRAAGAAADADRRGRGPDARAARRAAPDSLGYFNAAPRQERGLVRVRQGRDRLPGRVRRHAGQRRPARRPGGLARRDRPRSCARRRPTPGRRR